MSARAPQHLDPATLRWVADELERDRKRYLALSLDVQGGGLYIMLATHLRAEVRRYRGRASRIERKRGKP